jgi:hypothetical protein
MVTKGTFVKKIMVSLVFMFSTILTACFGYKPFQPNPFEYERWSKAGEEETNVRKAMLECGYPSPNGVRDRMVSMSATPDDVVMMYRCMTNSGYLYDGKNYDVCGTESGLASCQPGVPAPSRDVNKRLNSQFCKRFPHADVCS